MSQDFNNSSELLVYLQTGGLIKWEGDDGDGDVYRLTGKRFEYWTEESQDDEDEPFEEGTGHCHDSCFADCLLQYSNCRKFIANQPAYTFSPEVKALIDAIDADDVCCKKQLVGLVRELCQRLDKLEGKTNEA